MELERAIEYLKNIYPHPNFMVICYAYQKIYLLTWLGAEKGNFRYGFQPIEKTAFYELGIGDSGTGENSLKDYLNQCLDRGYKLFAAHSLSQLINNVQQLKDGDCHCLEPIIKDTFINKIVKIRLKEGTIVEGEILR